MAFRIGQKVVCVDDQPMHPDRLPRMARWDAKITRGKIYTVRWTGSYLMTWESSPKVRVRLFGVTRGGPLDTPYEPSRFRPLPERKTDISIFTEMLKRDRAPALSTAD